MSFRFSILISVIIPSNVFPKRPQSALVKLNRGSASVRSSLNLIDKIKATLYVLKVNWDAKKLESEKAKCVKELFLSRILTHILA
ncbi:hypothetical protein BpHYR1_024090 [Brachionus plicatilis]|uniref:Uncharacterized protein n=1 Tax=Brachionus plicatilis TaxID=10195 RepID=A0A3M7Q9N4_BRAPC|nr:hypothetical protein BpHYR1_024090 [Brachionus plicatilis]